MIDISKHIEELITEHNLAVERLTRKQFVELIKQMILSGDIIRHVQFESNDSVFGQNQYLTYIPFREVETLKAKIQILENKLKTLSNDSI